MNLIRLLLRTTKYNSELSTKLIDLVYEFGDWELHSEQFRENGWDLYLIGMEAGFCGWYDLMYIIMKGLSKKVETEGLYYWLSSLSLLAYAEWQLSLHRPSTDHFIKTLIELKTFQAFSQVGSFQHEFIQLRMEWIEVIQYVMRILVTPRKRAERIRQCAIRFRKIAFRYDFIAHVGCDEETMRVIESYKICALVCEHASRTLLSDQQFFCIDPSLIPLIQQPISHDDDQVGSSETLMDLCKVFLEKITKWEGLSHLEDADRFPVRRRYVDCLNS